MLANAQFSVQADEPAQELPSFVTTGGAAPSFDAFGSALPAGMLAAAQSATELIDVDPDDLEEWHRSVSRNAECPCGSGKKFKHCHGAI
jgi:preprotein translocase subunit SecA